MDIPFSDSLRQRLDAGLDALGLDATLAEPLLAYLALLSRWNRTYNLTAIRDPEEMVTRHLLDSLAMHPYVQPGALADLGTGPGLPGIPLAIVRPDLQVTLVESNGKKARFLREAVRQLGLGNARVAESRAEAVAEPGAYAQITARALDTLAGILEVGGHLLSPSGRLLAMKGIDPVEEIAAEVTRLADGARAGRLSAEELRDSTFTVTSAGKLGGLFVTPLVNHPEVAILGLHRVAERPVVRDGAIAVRHVGNVSVSFDHRVVDGARAAAFCLDVIAQLQSDGSPAA